MAVLKELIYTKLPYYNVFHSLKLACCYPINTVLPCPIKYPQKSQKKYWKWFSRPVVLILPVSNCLCHLYLLLLLEFSLFPQKHNNNQLPQGCFTLICSISKALKQSCFFESRLASEWKLNSNSISSNQNFKT